MSGDDQGRRILGVTPIVVGVDAAINWLVVRVEDESGRAGFGEGTLERSNAAVAEHIRALTPALIGSQPSEALTRLIEPEPTLIRSAALGALDQALWDLSARQRGTSLGIALAGHAAVVPTLYANINRAVVGDRSAQAFVDVALAAQEEGYEALKIAPFDGVERRSLADRDVRAAVEAGFERITAVLEAINVELRVDLHWRFETHAAVRVVAELAQLGLGWVEAPVRENDLDAWRVVRDTTDTRLAGGETLVSAEAFDTFLTASGVDVVMPDIKYCGGVTGFVRCLDVAARHGAEVAPHNPSGSVATLATVHAAAGRNLSSLEIPWRPVANELDVLRDGRLHLPSGAGLGLDLPADFATAFPAHPEPDIAPTDLI